MLISLLGRCYYHMRHIFLLKTNTWTINEQEWIFNVSHRIRYSYFWIGLNGLNDFFQHVQQNCNAHLKSCAIHNIYSNTHSYIFRSFRDRYAIYYVPHSAYIRSLSVNISWFYGFIWFCHSLTIFSFFFSIFFMFT